MAAITPQIKSMFSTFSARIANNANNRVKWNISEMDKNTTLIQRLSRLPDSLLSHFTGSWRPFKPDVGADQGLKINLRQIDAYNLDTPESIQQMRDLVQQATQEEIMKDLPGFLEPILQDLFNNKNPYISLEEDEPNKQLKLF